MAVDITINETIDSVDITVNPNIIEVNVTRTSGGGGAVDSVNGQTGVVVIPIPTNTSDLVNDGENGVDPFITLKDIPGNLSLYPTTASSDISGYFKLVTDIEDPDYNTTAVDVSTGAITTTNQLVSSLSTSAGVLIGNPGIVNITVVGNIKRVSGSGTATFKYEVYKRTDDGTETLVSTSGDTLPVTLSTYTEFFAISLLNDGIFLNTDRIVLKFYGDRVVGGSNPTYNFQFGGTIPVRAIFPVPSVNLPVPNLTQVLTAGDKEFQQIDGDRDFELADRLKYSLIGGGMTMTLDDDLDLFPTNSLIQFFVNDSSDINATATLNFGAGTSCYYLIGNITTLTLNVGDFCELKKAGAGSNWVLNVWNKSSGGGGASWGSITGTLSAQTDLQTALNGKVNGNASITGATKTKITYDSKGLVTAGADAEIADITGLQTALDAKVDETDWVDYTSLSTIVGWSSFTANKFIWYKIIDGIMFVNFYLEGTSNATNATFTLPNPNTIASFSLSAYIINNGAVTTNQVGRIFVPNGSATVTVNRDNVGTAYTASGTKTIAGQFFIKL